jgi:hypothetical protein
MTDRTVLLLGALKSCLPILDHRLWKVVRENFVLHWSGEKHEHLNVELLQKSWRFSETNPPL